MRRFSGLFVAAILLGGCGATSLTTTDGSDQVSGTSVEGGADRGEQKLDGVSGSSGFCDKNDVEYPVRRHADDIRACFEEQLKQNPGLSGRVDTTWTLGKDGRVTRVEATGPAPLRLCVTTVIKSIRFRPPLIGCEVIADYPFVFKAE